jgi:Flp pilus assembly protein TadG
MLRLPAIFRDQRGNSLIEMGLAAPLLAALLIGMVDISRAVSAKVSVEQAAQRALEKVQAQADFNTSQMPDLETDAEAAAGAGSNATANAWLECNHDGVHLDYDTGSCGTGVPYARYVSMTVQGSFTPLFTSSFFPGGANGNVTVNGRATVRVQ